MSSDLLSPVCRWDRENQAKSILCKAISTQVKKKNKTEQYQTKIKCQKSSTIKFVYCFPFQVLIVCSTGLAGIMLLNYQRDYTIWVLPLIIVCLFAFLVAHCFLSIYEMVVDVLFLCFAIDTKYNDGSPGREFYMDKVLMVSFALFSKSTDMVP